MASQVSVVVPFYNVEHYLTECLESLKRQTHRDLQVVLIDDGSTDDSARIAKTFVADDGRFLLLHRSNEGPGAARNAGLEAITGDFVAFLDGDDYLPGDAIEVLLDSLTATNSDIACGNVRRLRRGNAAQSVLHSQAFARSQPRTHITRFHALLRDTTVWNKLYRREFWERNREHLRFPEGVYYEDTPIAIAAHCLASSVDVLSKHVYVWRERMDGERSTSQRRAETRYLHDRMEALDRVNQLLEAHATPEVCRAHDNKVLRHDIPYHMTVLGESDDEFRAMFFRRVNDYLQHVEPQTLAALPAIERLRYELVRRNLQTELLDVLSFQRDHLTTTPVVRKRRTVYGDYPFRNDRRLKIPRDVYRLDSELNLVTRVDDVTWVDGQLRVTGHAYIRLLDQNGPRSSRKRLLLRARGGKRTFAIPMRTVDRPAITAHSDQRLYRYDWAGFEADIDPALLTQDNNKSRVWDVSVEVRTRGITRTGRLAHAAPGRAKRPPYAEVRPRVRARPYYTEQGQLEIRVAPTAAEVIDTSTDGGWLTITGRLSKPVDGARQLRISRRGRAAGTVSVPAAVDGTAFTATMQLETLLPAPEDLPPHDQLRSTGIDWDLALAAPDGSHRLRLALAEDVPDRRTTVHDREVLVRRTWQGNLTVTDRAFRPEIRAIGWEAGGNLVLGGTLANYTPRPAQFVLRRRHSGDEHVLPLAATGPDASAEDFRVVIPAVALTSLRGVRPLRPGTWDLVAVCPCASPTRHSVAVRLDHALLDALPGPQTVGGLTFAVKANGHDKVMIAAQLDRPDVERGGYNQARLQTGLYVKSRSRSTLDAVLFDTFRGKQYADNPRAIHEALRRRGDTRPHYWITHEDQVELPDDIEAVRIWSEQFYELMARTRHIVANDTLPEFFDKRADQVYLQTWHGTPLKRLAFDVKQLKSANPEKYLAQVTADVARWDHLISPSQELTAILRRAFRYDGDILETGSPRGDLLFSSDREERAARARELIGLRDDRRVVLYAPTWRDNRFFGPGRYAFSSGLDVPLLRESLGDDHVLLVRGHHLIDDTIPVDGVFSIDVSGYPEIYDLYLIADVLMTDYSGVMFDFAVTRKPMVFFAYDLELYRDQLRGFYFDYESIAPGPVLTTSAQVVDALRDINGVVASSADRYARFVDRFCEFDDGHAGDRVVERVFGI